jgi:hypothetical protein
MKTATLIFAVLLAFSLSAVTGIQTTKSLPSENLFNVDLLYAYVEPGASYAIAVLNFTSISNLTLPSNSGLTEVYTVQVFSGIENVGAKGAIGCQIGKGIDMELLMDLAMSYGSFGAYENLGLEPFEVSYSPLNPTLVAPISMNLVRLGYITIDENNTDIDFSSPETVKHVELTQYQDGFLYNTLLTEEELSQIDMFDPLGLPATNSPSPEPTTPSSPTPLPSEEPQQIGQEVIFGVAVTVAVLCVALGLLVYLVKRK